MFRSAKSVIVLLAACAAWGCQAPTDPDETLDVDDFVDLTVTPDPAVATESRGRTYRVVRGNNQPDEILEYDWNATFTLAVTLNKNADDSDLDLEFPIDISAATVKVQQASGGIVNPPTGGDVEHYDSVIVQSSSNRYGSSSTTNQMTLAVWYDLPSLRREALITATLAFRDNNGKTFSKNVDVRVAP